MRRFWRGLCTNGIGTAGVVLTTTSFVLFIIAELLRLLEVVTNAYVGLITYLALPGLFVAGLGLIPVGWWLYRRRSGKTTRQLLSERFDPELVAPRRSGARVVKIVAALSVVNLLFLGIGGARTLQFMDEPVFCGTACHSVMGPEWATYQKSPHARVKCVECHVGTGAEATFDAKLNGLWQMISVTFDLYERPIPTPVHNLRPARETCERCHWPEAFVGDRIKRIVAFADDRASTPRYTTLSLKVGSGQGNRRGEIHWHVAPQNQVRYLAADRARSTMRWVEVKQADGSFRRYTNRQLTASTKTQKTKHIQEVRTMDCVDCHNRVTHIYHDPERAVDRLVTDGVIPRDLPFARKNALDALTGSYPPGEGDEHTRRDVMGTYRRDHPETLQTHARQLDRAVDALLAVRKRNLHPGMNVGFNPYPDHLGHRLSLGCRRCHGPHMVDEAGEAVPNHCTLCHSILAYDSPTPFQFLDASAPDNRQTPMGKYLGREFLGRAASAPASGDPGRRRRQRTAQHMDIKTKIR